MQDNKQEMEQEQKQVITEAQILGYLDEGMTREDIAKELGLTKSDVAEIFQHPNLKYKKPRKKKTWVFVANDVQEQTSEVTEDVIIGEVEETSEVENDQFNTQDDAGEPVNRPENKAIWKA